MPSHARTRGQAGLHDGSSAVSAMRTRGQAAPQRRDRADLDRRQVLAMLDDMRRTMRDRLGTDDEKRIDGSRRRAGRISVPVRFHVITDGHEGALTRDSAEQQVDTLNAAYGGKTGGVDVGLTFRLAGYEVTANPDWFREPQRHEARMKKVLREGGPGTLNLYSAAVGSDVLGFSTFPQWYRDKPSGDGVVIDHRSVPGGPYRNFNLGYTAVHEIGHWLGLFHTFENGCEPPGDGIADTPYEAVPAEGCPWLKDTCAQAGYDAVHNFMNYGWDDCMREFTAGQARRIRTVWAAYRSPGRGVKKIPAEDLAARTVGGAR